MVMTIPTAMAIATRIPAHTGFTMFCQSHVNTWPMTVSALRTNGSAVVVNHVTNPPMIWRIHMNAGTTAFCHNHTNLSPIHCATFVIVGHTYVMNHDATAPTASLIPDHAACTPSLNQPIRLYITTTAAPSATRAMMIRPIGFMRIARLRARCAIVAAFVATVCATIAALCATVATTARPRAMMPVFCATLFDAVAVVFAAVATVVAAVFRAACVSRMLFVSRSALFASSTGAIAVCAHRSFCWDAASPMDATFHATKPATISGMNRMIVST